LDAIAEFGDEFDHGVGVHVLRILLRETAVGLALPGPIASRNVTCGRATCQSPHAPDHWHGPYI